MVDYAMQRANMVESQVRTADVTDRRIIRAMLAIAREDFVPEDARPTAYSDAHLLIGGVSGPRYLLAPRAFAKMVQGMSITAEDAVLDIGCATGYSAAVLATLARKVVALEQDAELVGKARKALAARGVENVTVHTGRLTDGVAAEGPYDAILINGGIAAAPASLFDQLKDGGRLAAIMVDGVIGQATIWRRERSNIDALPIFDAITPVLPDFRKAPGFVF